MRGVQRPRARNRARCSMALSAPRSPSPPLFQPSPPSPPFPPLTSPAIHHRDPPPLHLPSLVLAGAAVHRHRLYSLLSVTATDRKRHRAPLTFFPLHRRDPDAITLLSGSSPPHLPLLSSPPRMPFPPGFSPHPIPPPPSPGSSPVRQWELGSTIRSPSTSVADLPASATSPALIPPLLVAVITSGFVHRHNLRLNHRDLRCSTIVFLPFSSPIVPLSTAFLTLFSSFPPGFSPHPHFSHHREPLPFLLCLTAVAATIEHQKPLHLPCPCPPLLPPSTSSVVPKKSCHLHLLHRRLPSLLPSPGPLSLWPSPLTQEGLHCRTSPLSSSPPSFLLHRRPHLPLSLLLPPLFPPSSSFAIVAIHRRPLLIHRHGPSLPGPPSRAPPPLPLLPLLPLPLRSPISTRPAPPSASRPPSLFSSLPPSP